MFKKLLMFAGLLMLTSIARADYFEPDRVYQVAIASVTSVKVAVSTFAATQMDSPAMPERVSVEIQNIDSSANLWCVPGVAVSSAPVSGSRKIAAGASWVLSIADKFYTIAGVSTTAKLTVDVFCMSDGAAATNAIITQMH